jgi:hypothetical protein
MFGDKKYGSHLAFDESPDPRYRYLVTLAGQEEG